MEKLNICVDIDGTVTEPYYWLDIANNHFNKEIKPEDIREYEIHKVLEISREEYLDFYHLYGEIIHTNPSLRMAAKQNLWKINDFHNLYYVTAREEKMTKVTKKWFHFNQLPKGQLYVLGTHHKVKKAKELKCDIFIEDRYENAMELALEGFPVLLMDCGYNRKALVPGIIRVFHWDEIYYIIKNMEKVKLGQIKGIA